VQLFKSLVGAIDKDEDGWLTKEEIESLITAAKAAAVKAGVDLLGRIRITG